VAVPYLKLKRWLATANRMILSSDARYFRVGLGRRDRVFRSRVSQEAEIVVLRHQLAVLQRKVPATPALIAATDG
jgi:hypothetical protein